MRTFLGSKLHRIRVTSCHLDYVGSVSIDDSIMAVAGICHMEQVHVVNLANGERWVTYAIPAESGSGMFQMNGGGARLAVPGDRCVVMSYEHLATVEPRPRVIQFDDDDLTNTAWRLDDDPFGHVPSRIVEHGDDADPRAIFG